MIPNPVQVIHLRSRRPWLAILIAIAACREAPNEEPAAVRQRLSATSRASRDSVQEVGIGCQAGGAIAETVPLTLADLGPRARGGLGYISGPSGRLVVRNAADWPRVWRALADSVPLPSLNLRDSILVIVASPEYTAMPFRLEIEGIRRCSPTGGLVVLIRLHTQEALQDFGDRSIRGALIARKIDDGTDVRFVELSPVVRN